MIIERATKLRMARTATGQSAAQVARALGIMPATYRAYERGENRAPIDAAEKIAKLFGKTIGEVFGDDTPEISPPLPAPPPGGRDLPVLGSARGGSDGFDLAAGAAAMSYTDRPANLNGVNGAYAVFVYGASMEPRYYPGEMLHVHPHRPARAGDFVVVQLANGGDDTHGVVKRFVSRSDDALVVEQMNPSKKISYPADDVRAVHLIVGSTS